MLSEARAERSPASRVVSGLVSGTQGQARQQLTHWQHHLRCRFPPAPRLAHLGSCSTFLTSPGLDRCGAGRWARVGRGATEGCLSERLLLSTALGPHDDAAHPAALAGPSAGGVGQLG